MGAALACELELRVLVRDERSAAAVVRRGGLQIEGDPVRPVTASSDPAVLGDADVVVVAVKAFDTIAALGRLRGLLLPSCTVLSVQNGLEAVAHIDLALGEGHAIALGPTTEAALLLEPGSVRRTGSGTTTLGWALGREGGTLLDGLAGSLQRGGLGATVVRPIEPHVWAKAVVNAAINPLSALAGIPNGSLLERPELATRLFAIAREAAAVATAAGIALPFDDVATYVANVARATAANRSSMLHDLERGRPTEIEEIDGVIVRSARALGVPVPETARALDEVRARTKA